MAVIIGTDGNDQGATALVGTGEADTIHGRNGNDQLFGNGGNDILVGGLGKDDLYGGTGIDLASYVYSTVGVHVSLRDGIATGAIGDSDRLFSIENVWGSNHRDWLMGSSGANDLFGGGGDDYLEGLAGADRISGGNGMDMASYSQSNEGVYVNLMSGVTMFGHAEGDVLTSIESLDGSAFADQFKGTDGANELRGNGGDDLLRGEGGADTLRGGAGKDRIVGGSGMDKLYGGTGADRFIYEKVGDSTPGSYDRIFDFSKADGDRIDLEGIDARAHVAGNQSFNFIGTANFTNEGQVRFHHQNGDTIVECNIAEGSAPEMKIVLSGIINLAASDFIL